MKPTIFITLLVLAIASLACNALMGGIPTPLTPPSLTPALSEGTAQAEADPTLIRQWASRSRLEPGYLDDVAIGAPEDDPYCGESYLAGILEPEGEIILTLIYASPLLPQQVNLVQGENPGGILRVELMNSTSGLGKVIYESGQPAARQALTNNPCAEILSIPAEADFEADTIFITFDSMAAAAQLDAVELVGRLELFSDLPVFWRVPLPSAPTSLAANNLGMLYVATDPNGLYAYDLEGNQLKRFSTPSETIITDVTTDPFGNLVVADAAYGWFIVLSAEGEQLTAGGEDVAGQVAVSPRDGNVYLLIQDSIRVYTSDTATFLREMPLESGGYVGLAFDPAGHLYTIRHWEALLLELDPLTGEELDATPLKRSANVDIVPRDLAIDENGNFYVLFSMNAGRVAVHLLDPQGNLLRRFGQLTYDPENWPEGSFFEPRAIAVSPDGRFVFIADGFENTVYLTAFLLEAE